MRLIARLAAFLLALSLSISGVLLTSDRTSAVAAGLNDELRVEPAYDGNAMLTVNSIEYQDSLPQYLLSVTDVATGRGVPLQYGYASDVGDDLEDDYTTFTDEPLVVGSTYEAAFHVETTGFWHCSIYDKDGCSWYDATSDSSRWRFTWTGAAMLATPYTPPPIATQLKLGHKKKDGPHGWRVTATLRSDGSPMKRELLTGEIRFGKHGAWRRDGSWRTDGHGQLTLRFEGTDRTAYYRFNYRGTTTTEAAVSRPFAITQRR